MSAQWLTKWTKQPVMITSSKKSSYPGSPEHSMLPVPHCPLQPLPHRGCWVCYKSKGRWWWWPQVSMSWPHLFPVWPFLWAHPIPPDPPMGPSQVSWTACPGVQRAGLQRKALWLLKCSYLSYESIKVDGKWPFADLARFEGLDNIRKKCRSKKLSCCLHQWRALPWPSPHQVTIHHFPSGFPASPRIQ